MSKAEERALEAYPEGTRDVTGFVIDIGHPQYIRDFYIEGYHQAEKDNALTAEDVGVLVDIIQDDYKNTNTIFGMFKRVAKRFNESRMNRQNQ